MAKLLGSVSSCPWFVFRLYVGIILVLFSALSFCEVTFDTELHLVDQLEAILLHASFWFGFSSLFGAITLFWQSKFQGWKFGLVSGYLSALTSFTFLSYEYAMQKPPVLTGLVITITLTIFIAIGGILNGVTRRQVG